MSLTQDLINLKREMDEKLPPIGRSLFENLIKDLKDQKLAEKALKVGDQIPAFSLPDGTGKLISSGELLVRGPLVISFYRGAWCPYCNLELRALQEALPDFRSLGAELVAISPMTPDNSLSFAEKENLDFPVLSDEGLKVAKEFGLVYTIPLEVRAFLQKVGADLTAYNGDGSWRLPMPATYVTDHEGVVVSKVNADYRERMDPLDIYSALQKLT